MSVNTIKEYLRREKRLMKKDKRLFEMYESKEIKRVYAMIAENKYY